jgi:hypothetical protein
VLRKYNLQWADDTHRRSIGGSDCLNKGVSRFSSRFGRMFGPADARPHFFNDFGPGMGYTIASFANKANNLLHDTARGFCLTQRIPL